MAEVCMEAKLRNTHKKVAVHTYTEYSVLRECAWSHLQHAGESKEIFTASTECLGPVLVVSFCIMTQHCALNYLKALEALINGLNMVSEYDLPFQKLSFHKTYPTENPEGHSSSLI